jgi:hypothetical protein
MHKDDKLKYRGWGDMALKIDIGTLVSEVREIHEQFPGWTLDNAFVHWFLQAFLVADLEIASRSVTGVSHDKGIDGIYLDESSKQAFLVQGKLHKGSEPKNESRNNVIGFASLAKKISGSKADFDTFKIKIDPLVGAKLSEVRDRVLKRGYELRDHRKM